VISGGGSALMTLPVEGVTLADMQALTEALLRSGAPIGALNTVRKHLSQVKGGQLARLAHPATVITLIVSDVVGSPLDVIASGPAVPDPTTAAGARATLERFGVWDGAPEAIRRHLDATIAGQSADTPKADDPVFERVQNVVIADNALAAEAARARAEALGLNAAIMTTYLEGEAREIAIAWRAWEGDHRRAQPPVSAPGLPVVLAARQPSRCARGKGGRNQELALSAALALAGTRDILLASLRPTGRTAPPMGRAALVDGAPTVERAAARGCRRGRRWKITTPTRCWRRPAILLITGPTNTNVNDLSAVFIW